MTDSQKNRFREALARVSGDEEMLEMLATIVTEDAPEILRSMNEQVASEQLDAYAMSAHALKGLLSTFDTNEPVNEFQAAIDAARDGNLATVNTLHNRLVGPVQTLISEINAIAG